ncbi:MAG: hypothetical protein ACRC33_28130 [Gemmataceae bacterium]
MKSFSRRTRLAALKDDPVAWLKHAPGKDARNGPGWSSVTKPAVNETNQPTNVLLSPEMQGVFGSLLPFPRGPRRRGEGAGRRKASHQGRPQGRTAAIRAAHVAAGFAAGQ